MFPCPECCLHYFYHCKSTLGASTMWRTLDAHIHFYERFCGGCANHCHSMITARSDGKYSIAIRMSLVKIEYIILCINCLIRLAKCSFSSSLDSTRFTLLSFDPQTSSTLPPRAGFCECVTAATTSFKANFSPENGTSSPASSI